MDKPVFHLNQFYNSKYSQPVILDLLKESKKLGLENHIQDLSIFQVVLLGYLVEH